MGFKLPNQPFNNKGKIKPFVDPGLPKDFTPIATGAKEVVGTPFEGRAFIGTTSGGQRQPVGKTVSGLSTQRTGPRNERSFVTGVVQPKSVVGSSQDGIIKGTSTYIQEYKPGRRTGAKGPNMVGKTNNQTPGKVDTFKSNVRAQKAKSRRTSAKS